MWYARVRSGLELNLGAIIIRWSLSHKETCDCMGGESRKRRGGPRLSAEPCCRVREIEGMGVCETGEMTMTE